MLHLCVRGLKEGHELVWHKLVNSWPRLPMLTGDSKHLRWIWGRQLNFSVITWEKGQISKKAWKKSTSCRVVFFFFNLWVMNKKFPDKNHDWDMGYASILLWVAKPGQWLIRFLLLRIQ